MSEKRLNNTIFLMYLVTDNYCREHQITPKEFLQLNREHPIINYVAECPDIFDSMTNDEMVREVEQYVGTDFFDRLNDPETGLIYEPEGNLCEACILELEQGKEAMYHYITNI